MTLSRVFCTWTFFDFLTHCGLFWFQFIFLVSRSLSAKIIYQVFPVHESSTLKILQTKWVKKILQKQPMSKYFLFFSKFSKKLLLILLKNDFIFQDDICNYFGVQIALYFAWLGHYTKALFIPAFVGFMFWVCDVFFREIGFTKFFVKLILRKNNNKILLSLKLWINLIYITLKKCCCLTQLIQYITVS